MKKTLVIGAALLGCVSASQSVQAAPVFTNNVSNYLNFNAAVNSTGGSINAGDVVYGVVNLQTIKNESTGLYSWNADNVAPTYDSFTGYFAVKVQSVVTQSIPLIGNFTSYTFAPLTSVFGLFDANDVANKTMVKFYTDSTAVNGASATPYTTSNETNDIAHATDGQFWGSLGFGTNGYWIASTNPIANGTRGAVDFIVNNSGLSFGKVAAPCADGSSGCMFDMAFSSSFSPNPSGSAWGYTVSDPARLQPVPLPAAGWLLGSGLLGLVAMRRKN